MLNILIETIKSSAFSIPVNLESRFWIPDSEAIWSKSFDRIPKYDSNMLPLAANYSNVVKANSHSHISVMFLNQTFFVSQCHSFPFALYHLCVLEFLAEKESIWCSGISGGSSILWQQFRLPESHSY